MERDTLQDALYQWTPPFGTLAVMTSGGDAPGMNAAIRAVVRLARAKGIVVLGIEDGYGGLLDGEFINLDVADVAGLARRGGTILGSGRDLRMKTPEGIALAKQQLEAHGVDRLVVIGGNGSQSASLALQRAGVKVVGIASTIDNDLGGSDISIGVDTAINTAVDCIDKLKETANSHRRVFVVEVMGRGSGYLAAQTALATGADMVVCPEDSEPQADDVVRAAQAAFDGGKRHFLVVVAEGADTKTNDLVWALNAHGMDARGVVLGHIQRGGNPTAFDRNLATWLAEEAIFCLLGNLHGQVICWKQGHPAKVALATAVQPRQKVYFHQHALVQQLAGVTGIGGVVA